MTLVHFGNAKVFVLPQEKLFRMETSSKAFIHCNMYMFRSHRAARCCLSRKLERLPQAPTETIGHYDSLQERPIGNMMTSIAMGFG